MENEYYIEIEDRTYNLMQVCLNTLKFFSQTDRNALMHFLKYFILHVELWVALIMFMSCSIWQKEVK